MLGAIISASTGMSKLPPLLRTTMVLAGSGKGERPMINETGQDLAHGHFTVSTSYLTITYLILGASATKVDEDYFWRVDVGQDHVVGLDVKEDKSLTVNVLYMV